MDDLGDRALLLEDRLDAIDRGNGKRRHVLAEVDRKISLAVELVGRDRRTRYFRQNACANRHQPLAVSGALRLGNRENAAHAARLFVVGKVEGPVFANDTRHRPHAGDHVTPAAGRPVIGATAMPLALSRSSAS